MIRKLVAALLMGAAVVALNDDDGMDDATRNAVAGAREAAALARHALRHGEALRCAADVPGCLD